MRITDYQHKAIKEVITQRDVQAKIYLFGSRTDEHRRGGDIDLLILSEILTERDRRALRVALFERLGEQKLDLVIAKDLSSPFVRMAYSKSIPL
jgi:predicted nucleotidyltransferase